MFNLLALTSRLSSLRSQLSRITSKPDGERTDEESAKLSELRESVSDIEVRHRDWEVENQLRRHNYVGLVRSFTLCRSVRGDVDSYCGIRI